MDMKGEGVCEEAVYKGLFLKLAPGLRNFLSYQFKDLVKAEDAVQEAFKALWENCHKVAPHMAKAYLYKVAQNALLKTFRRNNYESREAALPLEVISKEDPLFELEYQELALQLKDAIAALPDGQREVFLMNRIDGLSYTEIAIALDISNKAVEKRMHKALIKLRETCIKI